MLGNTCSSCKHDRRSAKKIAVSTSNNTSKFALDLMWLARYAEWLCTSYVNLGNSGYRLTRGQMSMTSLTSSPSIIAARVIGNLCVRPPQGVHDPEVNGTPSASQRRVVRNPPKASAMSNYTNVVGSAQSDLKAIQAILVTQRDNGKHSVIPPTYQEYEPSYGSLPDSTVAKWSSIGISPVAAASACFLSKVPSNRSEVDAITLLFLEVLELVACPGEVHNLHEDVRTVGRIHQPVRSRRPDCYFFQGNSSGAAPLYDGRFMGVQQQPAFV